MFYSYRDSSVRLTGRWDVTSEACAVATAAGSYIDLCFEGDNALLAFDIETNNRPLLHLWIEVDGGARIEAPLDAYLRIRPKDDGKHTVRIIYKGGTEADNRWVPPLHGKVSFCGYTADKAVPMPEDDRLVVEWVGDSITEGVLIDPDYFGNGRPHEDIEQQNRRFQDDVCATYAWLVSEALDVRPSMMGYGATGMYHGGLGRTVDCPSAYPYNFHGSPVTRKAPDVVVINHGANDRADCERYLKGYEAWLDTVRAMYPKATIVALSAFCYAHNKELKAMLERYNDVHSCHVHFVDTDGWISPTPLHPLRDGHKTVAKNLTPILRNIIQNK